MATHIDYYVSLNSPWTHLGAARIEALASKHDATMRIHPVDFGTVFAGSGGLPLPKRAPQRQAYRLKELARWSKFLGLPMNLQPTYFPVQSDAAARLIIATQLAHGTNAALDLTGAVMRAIWEEEKNIADTDTLLAIANGLGHDGASLLKSSETASVQAEFDRFSEEATAANVFGAPWFVVDGEGYWGQDRLDFVERAFAEK